MHLIAVLVLHSALALFVSTVVMTQIPDLASLQWNNRVVLLFAASNDDRSLAKQKAKFEKASKDLAERDLKVFEIVGAASDAMQLQSRFGVKYGQFTVVLIGKDGGRKLKKEAVVEPDALFQTIDAMPMRRDEMHRQRGEQ